MRHSSDSSQTAPTAHPIFVTYIIIIRSIGFVVGGQLDDALKDPDGEQRGGTFCYANVYTNRLNRAKNTRWNYTPDWTPTTPTATTSTTHNTKIM